jgi:RNA polymerase sigma factor (sigma-70 family)
LSKYNFSANPGAPPPPAALGGDVRASRRLVEVIAPVIRARVGRQLSRLGASRARKVCVEFPDLVQDIFANLYEQDGKLLRQWDPERGLSFKNWIGLITQRALRKRLQDAQHHERPCAEPLDASGADTATNVTPLEVRAEIANFLEHLASRLSPRSRLILLQSCLYEEDVHSVAMSVGMTEQAVYAARARLKRLALEFLHELPPHGLSAAGRRGMSRKHGFKTGSGCS